MEEHKSLNDTENGTEEETSSVKLKRSKKSKKKDKKRKRSVSRDESDNELSKKLKSKHKKKCKKRHRHTKDKKYRLDKDKNIGESTTNEEDSIIGPEIPEDLKKAQSMAPMSKEEWEKRQSKIRRVYDEESGRTRLIKGDGEIIEEIVSRERHQEINRQASQGDGAFFQSTVKKWIPK